MFGFVVEGFVVEGFVGEGFVGEGFVGEGFVGGRVPSVVILCSLWRVSNNPVFPCFCIPIMYVGNTDCSQNTHFVRDNNRVKAIVIKCGYFDPRI